MTKDELQEARTNPDFLNHLEERRIVAIKNDDIFNLYEIMDSMLVLDLDEDKINQTYEEILKITFSKLEERINDNKKFDTNSDDIYYVRSLYEHSIEKWSFEDYNGASMLLVLLINMIDDEKLKNSFMVNLIASTRNIDLDSFYENCVEQDLIDKEEKYGYFITSFKFDVATYINDNSDLLDEVMEKLQLQKDTEN